MSVAVAVMRHWCVCSIRRLLRHPDGDRAWLAGDLRRPAPGSSSRPPVTLLKPLCGAEPGLYEHLRSFCRQDYPEFQIVFGVRDPADPALAVVQRLAAEFPSLPIDVVVNPQLHGSNYKISNLINMLERRDTMS